MYLILLSYDMMVLDFSLAMIPCLITVGLTVFDCSNGLGLGQTLSQLD